MKYFYCLLLATLTLVPLVGAAPQQSGPAKGPGWAFPVTDKVQPAEDPNAPVKIAGSTKTYTDSQLDDLFNPPDWFPDEHPAMPAIVAKGKGDVRACSSCHLPTGMGHPESAIVAGFTATYLLHQMADMKSGDRKTGGLMDVIAKAASDEDTQQSVAYFAALKPIYPYIKVVEATTVPKSHVQQGNMRVRLPEGGTEPLGNRIIVLPEDEKRILERDPHGSVTIAYVPPGSIAKGEALVKTGAGGKTVPCGICHGADLKGLGDVPRIAGLQPIYIFRQLYSFQHGTRGGNSAALMKTPVMNLSEDDMIALSAYLGSLAPQSAILSKTQRGRYHLPAHRFVIFSRAYTSVVLCVSAAVSPPARSHFLRGRTFAADVK
jgi:cytochrome c553